MPQEASTAPGCPRILIAGVGNIFLRDDAFGVEVVQRLSCRLLLPEVRVVDFGIRGLDLAYALLERYEAVILVDAIPRGGPPGTLYVVEPQPGTAAEGPALMAAHNLDPARVLRLVAALGGPAQRLVIVGCEPALPADDQELPAEMSAPVRAAVDEAVRLVEALAARLLSAGDTTEMADVVAGAVNSTLRKELRTCHP
jgi:hydrogenase maturation protease